MLPAAGGMRVHPNEIDRAEPLIRISGVKKHYPVTSGLILQRTKGIVKAVDGVSFDIREGQTYSLVGESGCGKTTTSRMILMVEPPTEGEVYFEGKNMRQFSRSERQTYSASVGAVFQDPWSSLNPRMRVASIVSEPLTTHHRLTKQEVRDQVGELLELHAERVRGALRAPGRACAAGAGCSPGAVAAPDYRGMALYPGKDDNTTLPEG